MLNMKKVAFILLLLAGADIYAVRFDVGFANTVAIPVSEQIAQLKKELTSANRSLFWSRLFRALSGNWVSHDLAQAQSDRFARSILDSDIAKTQSHIACIENKLKNLETNTVVARAT